MSDLISRQAAIDALREKVFHNLTDEFYGTMQVLDELPSAQPEIIHCKDCKHFDTHGKRCKVWNHGLSENEFCSRGERKE